MNETIGLEYVGCDHEEMRKMLLETSIKLLESTNINLQLATRIDSLEAELKKFRKVRPDSGKVSGNLD
jgi:hypothetical protein